MRTGAGGRPLSGAGATLELWGALAVTFVLGVRYRLSPDVPIGYLFAAAVLPVTVGVLRRYRGIGVILVLAVLAALSGLFLTWTVAGEGLADHSRMIVQTARVLGLALGTMALLWTRSVAGTRLTVMVYALGFLVGVAAFGEDPGNWKFSLSVPVTLLVLSLPQVHGRAKIETGALVALAVVSALNDARSGAAMMLIAATLVVTQRVGFRGGRRSMLLVLGRLALVAVAGFYSVQALVLDGALGEAAKDRTVEQIQTSGSVLVGGRPELGASIALITHQPTGYGAGALASPSEVAVAKEGMGKLGYDPENGYVEVYMFGTGFEVHSLLGDMWILFGLAGMLLAVGVLGYGLLGLAHALSRRIATGVLVFLVIRTVWDFAFSPFPNAMETLMLALAVSLPLAGREPAGTAAEPGVPAS